MKISCIVAMNSKGIIGFENQIPWYLPADLKYFKKLPKAIASSWEENVMKVLEDHCR